MAKLTEDQIKALNEEAEKLSDKALLLLIAKNLKKMSRAQKLTYMHRYGSEFWNEEKKEGK